MGNTQRTLHSSLTIGTKIDLDDNRFGGGLIEVKEWTQHTSNTKKVDSSGKLKTEITGRRHGRHLNYEVEGVALETGVDEEEEEESSMISKGIGLEEMWNVVLLRLSVQAHGVRL